MCDVNILSNKEMLHKSVADAATTRQLVNAFLMKQIISMEFNKIN